jgi:DNA-binding transcriptional LysR family regulator
VCASPGYLLRFGTPRSPQDLAAHRCITFDGLDAATAWTFAGPGDARLLVPVRSRLTVATADAAIAAAITGIGLTRVLSYQVAQAVRDGMLVSVLTDHEPRSVPATLIYPGQGRLPMKTRAFIDFAAVRLRERLSTVDAARFDNAAAAASASTATCQAKKTVPQLARRRPR